MDELKKYIDLQTIKMQSYRQLNRINNSIGFPYNLDIDNSSEISTVAKKNYIKPKIGGLEDQILVFLI